MSARTGSEDDEFDVWFAAFKDQSINPTALGELKRRPRPRRLGGGMSGASAALMVARHPIVLKWDKLESILGEAVARRDRAEQVENVKALQDLGASHVAIRADPSSGELLGIMAYPYIGPVDPGNRSRIGDLQKLIRDEFLKGNNARSVDEDFSLLFKRLLQTRFGKSEPVSDGFTDHATPAMEIPDLARFDAFLDVAIELIAGHSELDADVLNTVEDWPDRIIGINEAPPFPDSRLVHGDPRFANIMVDPVLRKIELIDYGAGEPGRHVFHDLARLEVDILLRTTDATAETESDRGEMIVARTKTMFSRQAEPASDDSRVRIAEIWREARDSAFARLRNDDERSLYALFVVNELLRRLKWHSEGHDVDEVGATIPEILLAIRSVTEVVPA